MACVLTYKTKAYINVGEAGHNNLWKEMFSSSLATYTLSIIEVNGAFFDTLVLHKQYSHQYSMKLFI